MEFVSGAADRRLEDHGGIGAWTRFQADGGLSMQTSMAGNAPTSPTMRLPTSGVDRLTLGVALTVLALVALGIGVAIVVGRVQPAPELSTPEGVALAYELTIQRGEPDAAWELLSSQARAATTRQEFVARASGLSGRGDVRLSVENVRIDGDTTHLDVVRTIPTSGFLGFGAGSFTTRSRITLVRERGEWRISVPSQPFVIMQPAGIRP